MWKQQVVEPVAVDDEVRQRLDRGVAVTERWMRQLDACRVMPSAVVRQDDAELVDVGRIEVADLPERKVQVAVVVQVYEVIAYVPPELGWRVVE